MSPPQAKSKPVRVALLLDEMHAPAVAEALRKRGHDVVAVAERPDLRAMTDEAVLEWAGQTSRRLVTENVKDFRRLYLAASEPVRGRARLLYTSRKTFPRSRRKSGRLIAALDAWLGHPEVGSRPIEDWLRPA